MRKLLLRFLINAVAVGITAEFIPGISYSGDISNLFFIAVVFSLVNMFIKPIVMLLALPVEIATLGLFTIVINAVMLYLVSYLVPFFTLSEFWFPGFTYGSILIAPLQIPLWGTALLGSVIIGGISAILFWLTK